MFCYLPSVEVFSSFPLVVQKTSSKRYGNSVPMCSMFVCLDRACVLVHVYLFGDVPIGVGMGMDMCALGVYRCQYIHV